jgi:hypothetical protein
MSAYLLNLTFDQAAAASASGLFVSNSSDPTSKVWYTLPSTWPSTTPGQGAQVQQAAALANWGTPVADSHSLQCNLGDGIYIRLAPRNGWSSPASLQLRFTAVFGRTPGGPASDALASPFVLSNNAPCCLYTTDTTASTDQQDFTPPGPDDSWIYYLGPLSQNAVGQKANGGGSNNGRTCVYSFIVGVTVIDSSGNWYTYGHDPEMGVLG